MIEKTVIDYLRSRLDAPVGAQTPKGPPGAYIVVERTGSGEKDGLLAAVLALRCVGPTLYDAIRLSTLARAEMKRLPLAVDNVFCARQESLYNQTDTRTKEYRYTAIFRVYYVEEDEA